MSERQRDTSNCQSPTIYADSLEAARRMCAEDPCVQILHHWKPSVVTGRVHLAKCSYIVRLWLLPGYHNHVRRCFGVIAPRREWRALKTLHCSGLGVPRPLAFVPRKLLDGPYTDAIVLEDLGLCNNLQTQFLRRPPAERDDWLRKLNCDLVGATELMVSHGVLDTDHSINNFVMTESDMLYRLDFEGARSISCPNLHPLLYGATLGSLVGSYATAVMIAEERDSLRSRITELATLLAERLKPSGLVIRCAEAYAQRWIRRKKGVSWPNDARFWY